MVDVRGVGLGAGAGLGAVVHLGGVLMGETSLRGLYLWRGEHKLRYCCMGLNIPKSVKFGEESNKFKFITQGHKTKIKCKVTINPNGQI